MEAENPLSGVNTFSFRNLFWIQFHENRISIGNRFLPSNVHFTIAYNEQSPDVNFHISKNTSDENNKPKIEIVRISKKLLEALMPDLVFRIIGNILIPITLSEVELDEAYFVSEKDISQDGEKIIRSTFTPDDYRIKKKKVSVNANLEEKILQFVENPEIQTLHLSKLKSVKDTVKALEGGVLTIGSKSYAAIYLLGNWYTIRQDHTLSTLFRGIVQEHTLCNIQRHFRRSLALIRHMETKADSEQQNAKAIVLRPFRRMFLGIRILHSFGRSFRL